MKKFSELINNYLDFKFYPAIIPPLIAALAIIPCVKFLPETWGYENGVLENLQVIVLIIGFCLSCFAKFNKRFFYFIGLIIILLLAREINYGRTIFFPIPGEVNSFYSWKDIKYGWLVNPLVGLYITGIAIYFIAGKVYLQMGKIIKDIKFPIWNFFLIFIGIGLGEYAEKATENFVLEEISELLFYVALVSLIWLYGYDKRLKNN